MGAKDTESETQHKGHRTCWSLTEMPDLERRIVEQGRHGGGGHQSWVVGSGWALPYAALPGRGETLM